MLTLTESIEAGVPPEFANREWGRYMVRQFYENQSRAAAEISDQFDHGIVKFEREGSTSTKVTVELEIDAAPGTDPESDVSRARDRVESVLEGYRRYVLRRCDETHCRDN